MRVAAMVVVARRTHTPHAHPARTHAHEREPMADSLDLETLERTLRGLDSAVDEPAPLDEVVATARRLVAPGKGVLAADESAGTASKRLDAVGIDATEEERRRYRQMLLTAPGLDEYVSGVILYDETVRQRVDDGARFPETLADHGILPGAKVDTGTIPLAGHEGEQVTSGLDGLRTRLAEYRDLGIAFAKWRAVIRIDDALPTRACLRANADAMARYAATCQEAGIVPMVEPEVLMDGDHDIERNLAVTTAVLRETFASLVALDVVLEGVVLKTNMVLPGTDCTTTASVDEVAEATLTCLRRTVPPAVAGVAFLSGGQSDRDATAHLDAINRKASEPAWPLTFSYARALQGVALEQWGRDPSDAAAAQQLLVHRARCAAAASTGTYKPEMEAEAAA